MISLPYLVRRYLVLCGVLMQVCFFAVPTFLSAETGVVRGSVFDRETALPLAGATVQLTPRTNALADDILYSFGRGRATLAQLTGEMAQQEQRAGAIAQRDGSFVIKNVKVGEYTLTVRYYGYKKFSQDVRVQASETVSIPDVRLALDPQGLEEIVVTGLASRTSKERAEVAVSRVDAAEYMEKRGMQYADLSQLLMGKVAGLQVAPSSGLVGSGTRFNVRSGGTFSTTTFPVVYVDGVRWNFTEIQSRPPLNNLLTDYNQEPPLYGVNSSGNGISTLIDLPPEDIERVEILKGPAASALYGTAGPNGVVLITTKQRSKNPKEQSDFQIQARLTFGYNEQARLYTPEMMLSYQDANNIFRVGRIANYALSANGGKDNIFFYASLNHREEEGIIAQNSHTRTSARLNLTAIPSEHLLLRFSSFFVATTNYRPLGGLSGPLGTVSAFGPDSTGASRSYGQFATRDNIANTEIRCDAQRFSGSLEAVYSPIHGLSLRSLIGTDIMSIRDNSVIEFPSRSSRELVQTQVSHLNVDVTLAYSTEITPWLHSISTLGTQGFARFIQGLRTLGNDIPSLQTPSLTGFRNSRLTELYENYREAGIFAHQELSFFNAVFASFGIRNDYSSAVGRDAPSIWYPRASVAARLDKLLSLPEEFAVFKLRSAYGESGILPGALAGTGLRWRGIQSSFGNALVLQGAGNNRLEPERYREWEIGTELNINNAVGLDISYYRQSCNNAILPGRQFSALSYNTLNGTNNRTALNIGHIEAWGLETHLYATLLRSAISQLDLDFILGYTDNIIVSGGIAQNSAYAGEFTELVNGYPRDALFQRKFMQPLFTRDGVYEAPHVTSSIFFAGRGLPLYTASFSASLKLWNVLTISAIAEGAFDFIIPNYSKQLDLSYENYAPAWRLATQLGVAEQRGARPMPGVVPLQPNTIEYRMAALIFAEQYDVINFHSAPYNQPGDFIRLREISLRYDATSLLRESASLSFLRSLFLSVSLRNVALWTRYDFPDPEVTAVGSLFYRSRYDAFAIQHPRVFHVTVSATF